MKINNSYNDAAHVSKLKNFNFSQRFFYNTLLPVFAREVKKLPYVKKLYCHSEDFKLHFGQIE